MQFYRIDNCKNILILDFILDWHTGILVHHFPIPQIIYIYIQVLSHKYRNYSFFLIFGMFSYKKLIYYSKQRPSDSMILNHLSARLIIPCWYRSLVFDAQNSVRLTSRASIFSKFLLSRRQARDKNRVQSETARSGLYAGCDNS